MPKSPTESMIGIMATNPREGYTHHPPAHPMSEVYVIGPKTRDQRPETPTTPDSQEAQSAQNPERLKTAAAAGATNESTNRLCIIDSGAGTSTGPAPPTENAGWRPATIEYCTDVVWLGEDEGLRVQAAQGKGAPEQPYKPNKWIAAWHAQGGRVECMCVKVNLVPGPQFWVLATGAHGIGHK
jgi:hypothetical protein